MAERQNEVLYYVEHRYQDEYGCIQKKEIGLFTTAELAEAAVEAVKDQLGFRDHPDGFRIQEIILDTVLWPDGF